MAALVGGVVGALIAPAVVFGAEASDCWTETHSADLRPVQVTVCLLEGGAIEVYTTTGEAPRMIDINLGYDALGTECWWRTAYPTPWVHLGEFSDGVAHVGYRPDGAPATVLEAFVPSCTSRPTESESVLEAAWELANRHVHELPEPSFNPDVGITGLETFLQVVVPDPVTDSLVSPLGTTLTVDIKIAAVGVDWGDGESEIFTESTFDSLTGYPDGAARHIYETKTCATPGAPRCHPSLSEYEISVGFDWFVRWRINLGPWSTIDVPDTVSTVPYDVDEIVARSVTTP